MAKRRAVNDKNGNGANAGYETELWQMADALSGSMERTFALARAASKKLNADSAGGTL